MSIILILIIYEFIHGVYRQKCRYKIYKLAEEKSKLENKPLLVVGDPHNGHGSKFFNSFMDTYKCGDITIDLTGAPLCNGIKTDILSYLKEQQSNSLVIFISCVLEYVDDIDLVIDEIYRVAGDSSNIFIVTVNKWALASLFYMDSTTPLTKRLINAPPIYDKITYS